MQSSPRTCTTCGGSGTRAAQSRWRCRARKDDEREPAGGGPLGGEAFAAVDAQAVRRIEREDALLSAADADHHFVVRVDAPAGAFHDADEDGAAPRQLAIEIAKLALDEERLQPLPAGEVAQRRRLDAALWRRRVDGCDVVA